MSKNTCEICGTLDSYWICAGCGKSICKDCANAFEGIFCHDCISLVNTDCICNKYKKEEEQKMALGNMKLIEAVSMFKLDPMRIGVEKDELYDEVKFSYLNASNDYITFTLETAKKKYIHRVPRLTIEEIKKIDDLASKVVQGIKKDKDILEASEEIIRQWKERNSIG